MKFRAVLVTGSRSLQMAEEKRAWALCILRRELEKLGHGDFVLHGGAVGPDTWATECADKAIVETHLVDGLVSTKYNKGGNLAAWEAHQGPPHGSYLVRDRALAQRAKALQQQGYLVEVIALIDPDSPTRGAAYTLAECAKLDLPWRQATYPEDLKRPPGSEP